MEIVTKKLNTKTRTTKTQTKSLLEFTWPHLHELFDIRHPGTSGFANKKTATFTCENPLGIRWFQKSRLYVRILWIYHPKSIGPFIMGGDETTWVELMTFWTRILVDATNAVWGWQKKSLNISSFQSWGWINNSHSSVPIHNFNTLHVLKHVLILKIIKRPHFRWGKVECCHWGSNKHLPKTRCGHCIFPMEIHGSATRSGPPLVLDRGSWLCSIQVINSLDLNWGSRWGLKRWNGERITELDWASWYNLLHWNHDKNHQPEITNLFDCWLKQPSEK